MTPALLAAIPGIIDSLVKIAAKVRELKEKRDAGQLTADDLDELFDQYLEKDYDSYIEEARLRANK